MDKEPKTIDGLLHGVAKEEYGEKYNDHLVEQYKSYLSLTDKIGERRLNTNSFFLTVNTSLITAIGLSNMLSPKILGPGQMQIDSQAANFLFILIGIAGGGLCYFWYRLTLSYRGLNSAKFKVVHEMEKLLPIRPYNLEWEALGRGENKGLYHPFTHIEIYVPWIFMALYFALVIFGIIKNMI